MRMFGLENESTLGKSISISTQTPHDSLLAETWRTLHKGVRPTPGQLLGSVSGELGLRQYLESNGHQLVVTSDKDGENSVLDQHLHDAEIVISQPFWPAYMTRERIAKAPKLKMCLTAGIGSDHVDDWRNQCLLDKQPESVSIKMLWVNSTH